MESGTREFLPGLVSVVTPVYNGEGHLSRMLDSVLAQTYPSLQMILADDGSEDGTLALAESYREKFSRRGYGYEILRGEHSCAAGAINLGLPLVRGEYLIWPLRPVPALLCGRRCRGADPGPGRIPGGPLPGGDFLGYALVPDLCVLRLLYAGIRPVF